MTRLLIAFLTLAAIGCTTPPKAVVVDETPKQSPAVARSDAESTLPGPEVGLRDPDVLSELPEDRGLRSPTTVTSATPGGSPTVIARPPSGPTPPPTGGTN